MMQDESKHRRTVKAIYLIDDSDDDAFLAKHLLHRSNVQVAFKAFTSLSEFLEFSKADKNIDALQSLVVVDLNLCIEKGTEVIPMIVAEHRDIAIGISTGSVDPLDKTNAQNAGAWFFVGKPLNLACLQEICRQTNQLQLHESGNGELHLLRMPQVHA